MTGMLKIRNVQKCKDEKIVKAANVRSTSASVIPKIKFYCHINRDKLRNKLHNKIFPYKTHVTIQCQSQLCLCKLATRQQYLTYSTIPSIQCLLLIQTLKQDRQYTYNVI